MISIRIKIDNNPNTIGGPRVRVGAKSEYVLYDPSGGGLKKIIRIYPEQSYRVDNPIQVRPIVIHTSIQSLIKLLNFQIKVRVYGRCKLSFAASICEKFEPLLKHVLHCKWKRHTKKKKMQIK